MRRSSALLFGWVPVLALGAFAMVGIVDATKKYRDAIDAAKVSEGRLEEVTQKAALLLQKKYGVHVGRSSRSDPTTKASSPKSKWQVERDNSAMDDSPIVAISLSADNEIEGWLKKSRPVLVVRCKEKRTQIFINVGMAANVEYTYGQHTVRFRLDDYKPNRELWSGSTDHEALFAPEAKALALDMLGTKKLTFEFTPFNGSPQTAIFDLRGYEEKLADVAKACGWKLPAQKK